MALTKELAQLKEVLPKLYSTVSNTATLPNFDRAEYKYVVPIIGTALYEDLLTKATAGTLNSKETVLAKNIRLVAGAYGTLDEIGLYTLTLQDSGAKKITQGGTEPIRAWEIAELKNTLANLATDGLDQLLAYLFANKNDFTAWTASDNYSKLKTLLIKTGSEMNDYYTLYQPQRTFFIMRNVMNDVQLLYLQNTIGKELLEYLVNKETPSVKEKYCIEFLKKSLAYYSVFKACKNFSVSFTDNGFTILGEKSVTTGDGRNDVPADRELLELKMEQLESEGKSFLELAMYELVKFYSDTSASAPYKTAFEAGRLTDYVNPEDRGSGNEGRKIYVMP